MNFFNNYQQSEAQKIGDNVINIEENKQTDPTKKDQSPKIENKRKVVNKSVEKLSIKPNQEVTNPKPADKDHTNHSVNKDCKAKPAKIVVKQANDNVPAQAEQQDKAPIKVTSQPVKMSYANVVRKEMPVEKCVEKPKNNPWVSFILVRNNFLNFTTKFLFNLYIFELLSLFFYSLLSQ